MDYDALPPSRLDDRALTTGLAALRPYYGGLGRLVETLSYVEGGQAYGAWLPQDVRRRVNRVLWDRIAPAVRRLPTNERIWLEALPVTSRITMHDVDRISGPVDWARSATLYGWPPMRFVVRQRDRVCDTLPLVVLRWVGQRVRAVAEDAESLARGILGMGQRSIDLLTMFVQDGNENPPSRGEVEAVRREGGLWIGVAAVASALLDAERQTDELLRSLLHPEEEGGVSGRVFQLATLGLMVEWFAANGRADSLGPIGPGGCAMFRVSANGLEWDLWFEAAFPGRLSGTHSLYSQARRGMPGSDTSLRIDLALFPIGEQRGLIVECKYSRNMNYIASGFPQVLGYLTEARHAGLAMCGLVVGPSGCVDSLHWVTTEEHKVAICDTSMLDKALSEFVSH